MRLSCTLVRIVNIQLQARCVAHCCHTGIFRSSGRLAYCTVAYTRSKLVLSIRRVDGHSWGLDSSMLNLVLKSSTSFLSTNPFAVWPLVGKGISNSCCLSFRLCSSKLARRSNVGCLQLSFSTYRMLPIRSRAVRIS